MRKRELTIILGAAMLVAGLGGCDNKGPDTRAGNVAEKSGESLAGSLDEAGDLSRASDLVKAAGLEKALGGTASYTFLAPVDSAFEQMPEDQSKLLASAEGRPQLIALLNQHILPGYLTAADLEKGFARKGGSAALKTMAGDAITLRKDGGVIVIGTGDTAPRIIGEPIAASNGIVYRIDRFIPPPAAEE